MYSFRFSFHYRFFSFCFVICFILLFFLTSCKKNPNLYLNEVCESNLFSTDTDGISETSKINDIDIFSLPCHPVYYGSVEYAKEFWKDYLGDRIILPGDNHKYISGKTLISISGFSSNNELLTDIELYFNNTSVGSMDLDVALKIISEYLPIELMKQYYYFDHSYIIEDADVNKSETFLYIIHYKITDYGYQIRESTKKDYYTMPYDIYIKLTSDDNSNSILYACIDSDLDNSYWDCNYHKNGLKETEWLYDFLS